MILSNTVDIFAAGTHEGAEKAWDTRGRGTKDKESTDRAKRALATHVPATAAKQRVAEANELIIAKAIGGKQLTDNSPFDVLKGKIGIEIKSVFPGVKNDKITMHPESRDRKLLAIKLMKLEKAVTVICDMRNSKFYVGEGVKSFRFGPKALAGGQGVKEVGLKDLRKYVK